MREPTRFLIRSGNHFEDEWIVEGRWYDGVVHESRRSPPSVRLFEPEPGGRVAIVPGAVIDWDAVREERDRAGGGSVARRP